MNAIVAAPAVSRSSRAGLPVTALPVLFLIFDATIKIVHIQPVTDASLQLGLPDGLNPGLGALELACLALYLVPRTAALGAALLTGYLGGAVAMHLRVGDPMASQTLFPVYIGAMFWAGLYLRDPRVRALLAPADRAS